MFLFLTLFLFGSILVLNLMFSFSLQTLYNFFVVCIFLLLPSIVSLSFRYLVPKEKLDGKAKFFHPKKFEKKLYNKIKVKKWKDKVTNLGNVGTILKNNAKSNCSKENLEYVVYQTCLGEVVHLFCIITCLFSTILLAIIKPNLFFCMTLPLSIIYIFVNLLPIFIQRYNRPRIINLISQLEK